MAAVGAGNLTLADWARRVDPDGKTPAIAECLTEINEVLLDQVWVEGNLPTGHKTTIRSGLPTVAWRLLNYGVQPSKSRTVQVTDTCGMLEGYSDVDKSLADLNGNTAAFRMSEDKAFLESMSQEYADVLFNGDTGSDPEKFMGLTPRFSSTSADNGGNIITADGSGSDNQSIWLVTWSEQTCHGIFPKGSKAGLNHQDLGEVTLQDSQTPSGNYQGYRSHYKWDCGVCVRDWRYVVRVPNIDYSALTKNAASGSDLVDLMVQAIEKLPSRMGRPVFYCNSTIRSFLRRQIMNRSNVWLSLETVAGKEALMFDGIPVRRVDKLGIAESLVS